MKDWEIVLNKFIDKYKDEPYFEGAILCGSHATGNDNEFSDIDVYIVTSESVTWRERGNLELDGYLIEYFINPTWKIVKYFEEGIQNMDLSAINMFITGKIIIDKNGEVQKLIDIASTKLNEEFNEISDCEKSSLKYHAWDYYDELNSAYADKRDGFHIIYYLLLQALIELYFKYKRIPRLPITKIDKIINDEEFRRKYNIKRYINKEIEDMIRKCLKHDDIDKMMNNITEFYNYVLNECGGLDIKNYVLRSEAK
jgi:predicted nucleotidyltransferase